MKDFKTLEAERLKLLETRPTFEQASQIRILHNEYQRKASTLVRQYMQKEIDVLEETKLKLTL